MLNKFAKGFTILEMLIYIFCLFLLTLIFFSIANLYINIRSNIGLLRSKLEVFIACNILFQNIRKASDFKFFKVIQRDNLVYSKVDLDNNLNNGVDIGWLVKSNNLYKCAGKYNINDNIWIKKRVSLISQNIKFIDFKRSLNLLNIIFKMSNFEDKYEIFVLPRLGIVF